MASPTDSLDLFLNAPSGGDGSEKRKASENTGGSDAKRARSGFLGNGPPVGPQDLAQSGTFPNSMLSSVDWQGIAMNIPPGTPLAELGQDKRTELESKVLKHAAENNMDAPREDILNSFYQSIEKGTSNPFGDFRGGILSSGYTSLAVPSQDDSFLGGALGVDLPGSGLGTSDPTNLSSVPHTKTEMGERDSHLPPVPAGTSYPSSQGDNGLSHDSASSAATAAALDGGATSSLAIGQQSRSDASTLSSGKSGSSSSKSRRKMGEDGYVGYDGEPFQWRYAPYQSKKLAERKKYFEKTLKRKMSALKDNQKKLMVYPKLDKSTAAMLSGEHNSLITGLKSTLVEIDRLLTEYILLPEDIPDLLKLQRGVNNELQQLELYVKELAYYQNRPSSDSHNCFATLVVITQPFPKAIKKNTKATLEQVEDFMQVRLLTGAKANVSPRGKVIAQMVMEDYHDKDGAVDTDEQELKNKCATFYNLKFSKSTRLKVARLRFSLDAYYENAEGRGKSSAVIESERTAPFIILTNESQWDSSEGILLKKDAFKGNEITFMRFANFLQLHYLRATRQDPTNPQRPLSLADLNFLAERLSHRSYISKQDFDNFWQWFGQVLRRIRHQQTFGALWMSGYVFGFVSREDSERILRGQPEGTFLIRFSQRVVGKIVITSVVKGKDGRPGFKHFLVSPDKNERPALLMEIIENREEYQRTVLLRTIFVPDDPEKGYVRGFEHKNQVFTEYYGKKASLGNLRQYYQM